MEVRIWFFPPLLAAEQSISMAFLIISPVIAEDPAVDVLTVANHARLNNATAFSVHRFSTESDAAGDGRRSAPGSEQAGAFSLFRK